MAKTVKKFSALLLAACLAVTLFGCKKPETKEDTGAGVIISGLPGSDITLTEQQLRQEFEPAERDAVSVNSKGDESQVRAKGVLLEDILRQKDISQSGFDSAEASAADGYSILIPNSVLQERELLIAFEYNGEPLENLRLVVPGERAMYWVKNLTGIAFTNVEPKPVEKEISLQDLINKLKSKAETYQYDGAACKALPIELMLQELGAEQTEFVEIIAADGLKKIERYSTFSAQMLIFEGTPDAPLFAGPDLPEGMRVKNIISIQIGDILIKATHTPQQ